MRRTMESLRSESGYQWGLGDLGARDEKNIEEDWKRKVGRREEPIWGEGMEKSKGSLGVCREVVERRGEIVVWRMVEESERVWWRRFRGGTLVGRRRENRWSDDKCVFCRCESGGMRHVVLECQEREIAEARERVLDRIGGEVGDVWNRMGREEQLWCTLGKEMQGCEVRDKCPRVWKEEWEMATTATRAKARRTMTAAGATKKAKRSKRSMTRRKTTTS